MKKHLMVWLLLVSSLSFAGTCGNGYTNSRMFVVPFGLVPNTDQTNFPVALAFNGASPFGSILLPDLKTVANGGKIQNTAANTLSVTGPADAIFCDAASAGNSLKFEVAAYNASTGATEFHVLIPTLSHTTNTSYWMFYGNAGVVTSQQDLSLWTTAGYGLVCHLPDGSSLNVKCSKSIGTEVNSGATADAGVNGGGANFVAASNQHISTGGTLYNATQSVEFWSKLPSTLTNCNQALLSEFNVSPDNGWQITTPTSVFGCSTTTTNDFINYDVANGSVYGNWRFNTGISPGAWTFASFTHTGTTVVGYLNGVSTSLSTNGTANPVGSNSGTMYFGQNLGGGASHMDGSLDEIRISGSVRSADWIATTYNDQSAPSGFSTMIDPSITGARVVQYTTCRGLAPTACTLPNNVVSGNMIITVSNTGETACSNSHYSDTRSSTFTLRAGTSNVGIADANSCILSAPLVSSGAETVTYTNGADTSGMVVYEIAGMSSPLLDVSNTVSASTQTITTPSVTATTSNSLLICGSAIKATGSPVQTFSPSGATAFTINNFRSSNAVGGSAIIQFTGSGSKSCAFTFGTASSHEAATIAVIKYTPVLVASKRRSAQIY